MKIYTTVLLFYSSLINLTARTNSILSSGYLADNESSIEQKLFDPDDSSQSSIGNKYFSFYHAALKLDTSDSGKQHSKSKTEFFNYSGTSDDNDFYKDYLLFLRDQKHIKANDESEQALFDSKAKTEIFNCFGSSNDNDFHE
ncbi:MAG: hypothetical protein KC505_04410 [Myxococcales bacterium]|nr:hypothetical protein [Myxococcales bacterium]USN50600.1 MAG: hypothetical protein H6731_10110 [Myxococcales bacterium]